MKHLIRKSVEAMHGYVPGEQPSDPLVIKLNTNENPYPPSPAVARALSGLAAEKLRKYPNPVSAELKAAIAQVHECEDSRVFVGNGSDEILALCTRAFVENDGRIGYLDPSYSLYPVLADIRNVQKTAYPLGPDFEWPFDMAGSDEPLRSACSCSLFFLTNPNAPTGILYPREKVRDFCRRVQGVVVLDEAYVDFSAGHCMDLALELDNVLVLRTLSKSFSLAGLRVGYAVGPAPLVEALFKIKDSYNLDRVSQELALAAVSDMKHMRGNVARIRATRARLQKFLADRGFAVYPSETNFLWARPGKMKARDLFERLRERRILIRYFPGPRTGDFVRITIGTDEEIDRLMEAVAEITAG